MTMFIKRYSLVLLIAASVAYLAGCSGGKFCMSLNQISEVNETQSLKDKK